MGYSQRTHVNAVLDSEAKNQSGHASVVLSVIGLPERIRESRKYYDENNGPESQIMKRKFNSRFVIKRIDVANVLFVELKEKRP
ncbi:unnamed protein product [Brugia pahangi]|uniref:DUF1330 domain-containing protein n=1 Tax=Brugia pahangi TaxID=6280 RepID=A0A0N4TKK4_BRUPA|nr:unnamed protein product [Brugia pahangi]